jgi:predicted CoA-substrate-specific enzyme activase
MIEDPALLYIGIDLGAASIKAVCCNSLGSPLHMACAPSKGSPLSSLLRILAEYPKDLYVRRTLKVSLTGTGQSLLRSITPSISVTEAVATAFAVQKEFRHARTIIDLGGHLSKWILLSAPGDDAGTVVDFETNGLCAAGSGAFLEQQATRLGLDVDSLGRIAATAPRGAAIAGRCSVFAKSDMIHLQQKGTPLNEIAMGLCNAMARTFGSTVLQGRKVEPPVVLVGGGAGNPGLVRAFRDALGLSDGDLLVPQHPSFWTAHGAAMMAAPAPVTDMESLLRYLRNRSAVFARASDSSSATALSGNTTVIPNEEVRDAIQSRNRDEQALSGTHVASAVPSVVPGSLPPLGTAAMLEEPQPPEDPQSLADEAEVYLGVDVGSVSTNLVLLRPDIRVFQGIYLPTAGRPAEALEEGLRRIRERFGTRLTFLGVGSTGSGRHLAAKLLGADVTHNEITAQMVSSLCFVPEADTIFEIGGQDSKYIYIRDGRLADFEMNKICAGGTGSFLEEQAQRLGVRIFDEFAAMAMAATKPCELGTRCTVFMDTELVRAQERGVPIGDLCAGLAYSVVRNYLEKVVAGRPIGKRIIFQGGTASNAAVVAAFRKLLNRPLQVHPYNRISGAIGAALLAARAGPRHSRFLGLQSCIGSELESFECESCENRCQVNRVRIGGRTIHFGDVCERYSESDRMPHEIERPFPELFAARQLLMEKQLAPALETHSDNPRLGLLRASLNFEFLPFWTTFLRELGYLPVLSGRTNSAQMQEYARGVPSEVCLPIKAAAAHAHSLLGYGEVDKIFVPILLECPSQAQDDQAHTCFYSQQLADMLRVELKSRIITAQFVMRNGLLGLLEPVLMLAKALGRSMDDVLRAFTRARSAQAVYVNERKRLGWEALKTRFDRAVVVIGRPYNTHDPYLNLSLARHLEQSGLPAIPWDLLPLDEVHLSERWRTVPWHYAREQLRAVEFIRGDERLYPLMVSNFGCGPDAFTVKHMEELLADRPRLLLEFDEHRGEAGLVTRLEAFNDEIEEHVQKRNPRLSFPSSTPGPRAMPSGRRFFIPHFTEHAEIYASVLRASGYTAQVLPLPDEATVRVGEEHASGRECHPYAILAGELVRFLQTGSPEPGDVFLLPNCATPCLIRQYGDAFRIMLERQNLPKIEIWDAASAQLGLLIGVAGLLRLYEGLLATDILLTLSTRLRPYEEQSGAIDCVTASNLARLSQAIGRRTRSNKILSEAAAQLWAVPRRDQLRTRPLVGVTGDLYTRINSLGNAGLFRRLESMGCEVWPSPFFANAIDLSATLSFSREAERGRFRAAAVEGLARALTSAIRRRLVHDLPEHTARVAVEPPAEDLVRFAQRYVGPGSNYLILLTVAKICDFLKRGASGVINAAAINCMVGTTAAAAIPAIRDEFSEAPVITLFYGATEGPSQRIRLETFVHQVKRRSTMDFTETQNGDRTRINRIK